MRRRPYPNQFSRKQEMNQARPKESQLLVRGEGLILPVGKLVKPVPGFLVRAR